MTPHESIHESLAGFQIIDTLPLPARSRYILKERLAGKTLESVGLRLGVTRERIRQLQALALATIPEPLAHDLRRQLQETKPNERQSRMAYLATKRRIQAALAAGFDRLEILRAAEVEADPHFAALSEVELCDWLHDTFVLTRFGGKYIYCILCHVPKLGADFSAATASGVGQYRVCRDCQRQRQNRYYHANSAKLMDYARTRPNRQAIYGKRSQMKRLGRLEEVPPLPPPGIQGDIPIEWVQQYIPLRGQGYGAGFREWCKNATPQQLKDRYEKGRRTRERNRQLSPGV